MSTEFYWVASALVAITSAARITRLATVDKFPPVVWLRNKYADLTDGSGWVWLAFCGYCFSFWAMVGVVVHGYFAGPLDGVSGNGFWGETLWWLIHGTLGGSYLAAVLMANDGDDSEDD